MTSSETVSRARSRIRAVFGDDLRFVLVVFVLGWLLTSALGVVGWQLPHGHAEHASRWAARDPATPWFAAFTGLEHNDAQWYLQIASGGYRNDDGSAAFFPLYPLTVRLVGTALGGHWLLAALLVSSIAFCGALWVLLRLTRGVLGERRARWAVVLTAANPYAVFFYAPYSDSLFLLLAVSCLSMLSQERVATAGVLAAVASATRSSGVVLGAAIAVDGVRRLRRSEASNWHAVLPRLLWSSAALLGPVAYFLYWERRSDWARPLEVQNSVFRREAAYPWESLGRAFKVAGQTLGDRSHLLTNLEAALGLSLLALGVLAARRYGPSMAAFVVGSLLLPLCLVRPFSPLSSTPRYFMTVFPIWWVCSGFHARARAIVLVVLLVLQVLVTLLFVSWHGVI